MPTDPPVSCVPTCGKWEKARTPAQQVGVGDDLGVSDGLGIAVISLN
jgi:hypothetical protein